MRGSAWQGGHWRWGERGSVGLCGQQGGHNRRTGCLGSVLAEPCPVSLPGAQLPSGHVCAERPETWRAASEDLANRECGSHVADTPTPPQEGTCGDPPDEESRETSPGQPQRPGAQAGARGRCPLRKYLSSGSQTEGFRSRALCLGLSVPDLVPSGKHLGAQTQSHPPACRGLGGPDVRPPVSRPHPLSELAFPA